MLAVRDTQGSPHAGEDIGTVEHLLVEIEGNCLQEFIAAFNPDRENTL